MRQLDENCVVQNRLEHNRGRVVVLTQPWVRDREESLRTIFRWNTINILQRRFTSPVTAISCNQIMLALNKQKESYKLFLNPLQQHKIEPQVNETRMETSYFSLSPSFQDELMV